jgi:hypothetical protein
MRTGYLSSLGVGWCVLAACGSQSSPDYVGESLLTLEGRVEIADAQTEGSLRPALAFRIHTTHGDELHFLDVETEGEFPADFVLRILKPPSQKVMDATRKTYEVFHDDRPPFPAAYLTAVTDDLPGAIDAEPSPMYSSNCVSGPPCAVDMRWCLNSSYDWWDGEDCYSEQRECATGALAFDDCTPVSSEGNPKVPDYPWQRLAGLSQDLRILYLPKRLSADDPVAVEFGLPALEAGYHALEVTPPTEGELEEAAACKMALYAEAIAEYNAEHDSEYTYDDIAKCLSELYHLEECANDGALSLVLTAGQKRIYRDGRLREDLSCSPIAETRRRVLTAEELNHISVRIASGVEPSGSGESAW